MILGITGSIGTGKSTVSRLFEKKGAIRIDADALAHEAIEKGRTPYRSVVRFFGKRILRGNGEIDRGKLARIVFKNRKILEALNARVHPYVLRRIMEEIRRVLRRKKGRMIVVEVPLLHEKHLSAMFDKVLTVSCKGSVQERRWVKGGRRLGELKARRASQLPLSYKERKSDFIIDNSRSIRETNAQVNRIWRIIEAQRSLGLGGLGIHSRKEREKDGRTKDRNRSNTR